MSISSNFFDYATVTKWLFERNYVAEATFDIYDLNGRCIGLDR